MILLTLKMALDYFYHEGYPKLFLSEESLKVRANEVAFDKLLLFVEKLLDQGNINGRFVFLESDIDGPKGNFIKDKKFIRKRIFTHVMKHKPVKIMQYRTVPSKAARRKIKQLLKLFLSLLKPSRFVIEPSKAVLII